MIELGRFVNMLIISTANQVEFHNYMFLYNVMDDARSWVSRENGIEQQNGHAIKA